MKHQCTLGNQERRAKNMRKILINYENDKFTGHLLRPDGNYIGFAEVGSLEELLAYLSFFKVTRQEWANLEMV